MKICDQQHYDELYRSGYMSGFQDIYEYCRLKTVRHAMRYLRKRISPQMILDVGCGQGRYLTVAKTFFPGSEFSGVDISQSAISLASKQHTDARFYVGCAEKLDMVKDGSVDLLINIEVLEHVGDIRQTVREFSRVLRRNGFILFTTPCSNRFSLEWFENAYRNTIENTDDGFHRFGTDPIEHVRRLTGNEIRQTFDSNGLSMQYLRYRAHIFTRVFHLFYKYLKKRWPDNRCFRILAEIACLDWRLFRCLPNGATMVGFARKR